MDVLADFWHGRRVFLTGHTGFKGSWMTLWLHAMGARVFGYALDPPAGAPLFTMLGLERVIAADTRADVRAGDELLRALRSAQPQVVFHFAAQPLVRASFLQPVETFEINAIGTAHLLEAVRQITSVRAVVVITSDKCYGGDPGEHGHREDDCLGGRDPYSASKACAELVAAAYRASFLEGRPPELTVALATARAGNVIGGGDWALDRLVPDCVRAIGQGQPVILRYPRAIRPWQHVLEPLRGYLMLAQRLAADGAPFAEAWNFGPDACSHVSVDTLAHGLVERFGTGSVLHQEERGTREAGRLVLDITKARSHLGWAPRWDLAQTLDATVSWYQASSSGEDIRRLSLAQIDRYMGAA